MIANIAVSAAIFAIDKPYAYRVPASMELLPGMRVTVPFGRANKRCEGLVLQLVEGDETKLKPVLERLDDVPLLDEKALHLAAFLRERYFCTLYDALKAILPAGVWFYESERYTIADETWEARIHRQPVALAVMQTIASLGGTAEEQTLQKQFAPEPLAQALRYLLRKKLLTTQTDRRRRVSDKTQCVAVLAVSAEEAGEYARSKQRTAPMQTAVLELLMTLGECAVKELCYFTGASGATVRRLAQLGLLELTETPLLRTSEVIPARLTGPLVLTREQEAVYQGLSAQFSRESPGIALLKGVTGSGKTAVYIRLIQDCLEKGKSAMLLVPEISLTPQLLSLFAAYFGAQVAMLHSSLRITERYDTWKRIRSGEARVVLGTRSAVFAPLQNPGLLIVDEEHEHTYKSENTPRYHAREVAIYRAGQYAAAVLLGSATPSVESMFRAKEGIYTQYTLKHRYNGRELPPVELVDMKQELQDGNATAISQSLLRALQENLARGEQAILFLNRRGASRMVACVDCGEVPTCPGCSVHLTYHQANGRLMCHYCGHSQALPNRCPSCGGPYKQIGFGTQKVEQQLRNLLPGAEVLRMDADTVSATNSHETLLRRFREERIPILLGTQMVTKGLNFENVTLVGVLDADMSLYVPHYRAAETTFSIITQVVGRAGRGAAHGRAIIQTMTPENQVLLQAACQDYEAFYEAELPMRRLRSCPPLRDLLTVTFHGRQEEQVWQTALDFRSILLTQLDSDYYRRETAQVLGPAPAAVAWVNYRYRCRLTISCRLTRPLRQLIAHLMRLYLTEKRYNGVGIYSDVNSNE